MTGLSGAWKPAVNGEAKKLAGPCEVTNLKLISGSAAAYVAFYDGQDASAIKPTNLVWALDSAIGANDSDHFEAALVFQRGVYAVLEQGGGSNPVVLIARRNYETQKA